PSRRLRCPHIDREREFALERDIALDAHAKGELQRLHFSETERSKLGLAEVGQTEYRVAVLIEPGRNPGADAERIEELHHRNLIETPVAAVAAAAIAHDILEADHAS